MFKKIFLVSVLLLVSCWDNTVVDNVWLNNIDKWNFSINIPSNWEIIENTQNILPKPNNWEIELAVASKVLKNWFKNNLLILSDELNTFTSSKDFSMLNNVWASKDYIDYTLLDTKKFIFTDLEESVLYIFEAKYNYDSPKLKFLQTAHICNQKKWYFFTIAIPVSIKDTSKYEALLQSFACKNLTNDEL